MGRIWFDSYLMSIDLFPLIVSGFIFIVMLAFPYFYRYAENKISFTIVICRFGKLYFEINDMTLSGVDELKQFISVCFASIVLQGRLSLSNVRNKSGNVYNAQ